MTPKFKTLRIASKKHGEKFIVYDEIDSVFIEGKKWSIAENYKNKFYAVSNEAIGSSKKIYMHKIIMPHAGTSHVDHINGNTLDNRRCNLRYASSSQNAANNRNVRSKCGFKGVSHYSTGKSFRAKIVFKSERIHLGTFNNPHDAAKAYDEAALKYFGEFAATNKSMGLL